MYDLKIINAIVIDGTGSQRFLGEVAVNKDIIVDRGQKLGLSKNVFDAEGHILCPGIIDTHTHYDAQLTWDNLASPSLDLGVTTAIIGNCGFTIAPCKPFVLIPIKPSAAILLDFFAIADKPCFLSQSIASSIFPLDSTKAFLQSIMPAPLFSLNSLTIDADNVIIFPFYALNTYEYNLYK